MWDLGSPSKNWTCVPWIGRWILNHWTTREVPVCIFKKRWRGKHSVLLASQGVTISQHEFGRKEGICQIKVLFLFVLEKEMATHSSILSWRNPWMEEPGGLQSTGRKESDTTEWLHFHFTLFVSFPMQKLLVSGSFLVCLFLKDFFFFYCASFWKSLLNLL